MTTGLQGLFERFAADPSQEHFRALRAQMVDEPTYNPLAGDVEAAARLLADGDAARAWETLVPAMANHLLSPRAHLLLAAAAERLGEAEEARRRRDLAAACLRGILATGDGTAQRPYLVTRVSDEYDILDHVGARWTRQSLRRHGGRACEVFDLEGGGEVWFDITEAHSRMGGIWPA
jgi:hypothetical protein